MMENNAKLFGDDEIFEKIISSEKPVKSKNWGVKSETLIGRCGMHIATKSIGIAAKTPEPDLFAMHKMKPNKRAGKKIKLNEGPKIRDTLG